MTGDSGFRGQRPLVVLFLALCCILYPLSLCPAATITADHLEHFEDDDRYEATGDVHIEKEDVQIRAERAIYHRGTSEAETFGHTLYADKEIVIKAEGVRLNLDDKTGTIEKAVIFFKKDNTWVSGKTFEKIEEHHYYAPEGLFTTCDTRPLFTPETFSQKRVKDASLSAWSPLENAESLFESERPDWCFKGSDVDIVVGEQLKAKNVTYRLKGLPVLYSPYMWLPIGKERQTGLLIPVIGNSSRKGFQFSPAFFLVIDDIRDATLYLDYYSRRGIGQGIEYRHLNSLGLNSWYGYHIRDREFEKDFYELKASERSQWGKVSGYLDINYINDPDFYKEYGFSPDIRLRHYLQLSTVNRFLQSTGELTLPLKDSRLYFLSQYWVDLNVQDANVPQRLPEAGYVMNPTRVGPFTFSMSPSVSHFYRESDVRGDRLDLNPTLSYSFGDVVQLFQSLTLRETAYNLTDGGSFGSTPHRETLEYRAQALTRFVKQYSSFTHIVEPSLEYGFIPETRDLPLFDSIDLINKTSQVQFSLLNTIISNTVSLTFRVSQPYDLNGSDSGEHLLPTRLEASLTKPFALRLDMSQDFDKGRTETVNSDVSFKLFDKVSLALGERYSRTNNILFYTAGIDTPITRKLHFNTYITYDGKTRELRDATAKAVYTEQCWALNAIVTRRPGDGTRPSDFSFGLLFELKGIGKYRVL